MNGTGSLGIQYYPIITSESILPRESSCNCFDQIVKNLPITVMSYPYVV